MLKPQTYQIVVNSFGETYPEEDPYNYTTFSHICKYVENGGVFVNVAGIPFWYCHNPKDFSLVDQTVRAGRIQLEYGKDEKNTATQKPLFSSLFPQLKSWTDATDVHCAQTEEERKQFNGIVDAGGDSKAKMFRAYDPGTQDMLPLLRAETPAKWLIGGIKYGDGFFLLAGLDLRGKNNTSFAKVVASIRAWVEYEARGRP